MHNINKTVMTSKGLLMLTMVDSLIGPYYAILNITTRELRTVAQDKTIALTVFNQLINKG